MERFMGPIERFLGRLDMLYARILGWTVRHRRSTILIAMGIFVASLFGLNFHQNLLHAPAGYWVHGGNH